MIKGATINLYLVKPKDGDAWHFGSYDTYDSFVCVADSEEQAVKLTPNGSPFTSDDWSSWCPSPDFVVAELIGRSDETTSRVVLASFNAG